METKSNPGQDVVTMVEQHIDFEKELKMYRANLVHRNSMLNSKIAADIVKSDIESISDWVKRISKDIVVWRDDLMHLESELKKIDDEFYMIECLRESTADYLDSALREAKLLNDLRKIRLEKSKNEQSMIDHSRTLSKIRGLSAKPVDESKWSPNKTGDLSVSFDISTTPMDDSVIIPINTIDVFDNAAKIRWTYSNQSNLDFSSWTVRGSCSKCNLKFNDDSHICPIDGVRKIVPGEAWDFSMVRFSAAISAIKMRQSAPINLSDSGEVGPDLGHGSGTAEIVD